MKTLALGQVKPQEVPFAALDPRHLFMQNLLFMLPFWRPQRQGANVTAVDSYPVFWGSTVPRTPTFQLTAGWQFTKHTNKAGNCINFGHQSNYINLGSDPIPANAVTICMVRLRTAAGLNSGIQVANSSLGTSNPKESAIYLPFSDGTVYWDFGGRTGGTTRLSVAGLTLSLVEPERWVFTAGPRGMAIWRNGVKVGSHTTANPGRTVDPATTLRLNSFDGNASGDICTLNYIAAYSVQWGDEQCRSWCAEPVRAPVSEARDRCGAGRWRPDDPALAVPVAYPHAGRWLFKGTPVIKNTASQSVGVQMVAAADGSAFTGTVTVYVTLDRGTQAIGTVGSGVCAHEGNGCHTYAPSQAETNGDFNQYTFIGTGAVPQTVQVYTRAAAPDVNVTHAAGTAWASGAITSGVFASGAIAAGAIAADAIGASELAADAVAEIADAVWDEAIAGHLGAGSTGEALDNAGAGGTPPTAVENAEAVWDELLASHVISGSAGEALGLLNGAEIADRILARNLAGGSDGGRTVQDALRALRNRVAVAAGTVTVYEEDDTTPAWDGAVTTAAGDPFTEVNPS